MIMSEGARSPDFLYIGTSKAGSTWLFSTLAVHPQVYLASDKGLYFFDHHYDRGQRWYRERFAMADGARLAGEISHSYLSSPDTPGRIREMNPRIRLLACLREPVDRAFSDYLDLVKNGQFDGPFETAIEEVPRLLDRGRYATHLRRYLDTFDRGQLQVQLFDDLRLDAQRYADEVFDFLGVERLALTVGARRPRMQAGLPRSTAVGAVAKAASQAAVHLGLRRLRGRVKRSTFVRNALYRPYTRADRPTVDPATRARLREDFASEVQALDELLGTPISTRWGYSPS